MILIGQSVTRVKLRNASLSEVKSTQSRSLEKSALKSECPACAGSMRSDFFKHARVRATCAVIIVMSKIAKFCLCCVEFPGPYDRTRRDWGRECRRNEFQGVKSRPCAQIKISRGNHTTSQDFPFFSIYFFGLFPFLTINCYRR